ncbi:MAG: hypothetical protein PVG14_01160 [Anaerolineales bacterium]|jgi:hypothetical protein
MLSLSTAIKLKSAGLTWIPALHDFFAVPDRELDDRLFVISDIMAYVEFRNNLPMVTFHGVVEWALDYVLTQEVVWIPRESQLRTRLMQLLVSEKQPALRLDSTLDGYSCVIQLHGKEHRFDSSEASEAYASALLFVLEEG